ncbi:MFS transporter [Zhongshania sp.]|uniref:MFS transporter n=1 Tax=Zhongshania sp. TaxID=1971902 RepID=UPI0035697E43
MSIKITSPWWQLVAAMLAQAICGGSIFSAYSVVVAPLKMEFAPSNMVLMLGMTVTSLASGLLSPYFGGAIDRISIRRLMLFGIALVVGGFLCLSVTSSMNQVIVIYAVFMATGSILLGPIATSALLARWFTQNRGLAMGIAASGSALGGLLFPPLLQGLIDGLEWRLALQVFSGLILLVAVPVIALLVKDYPPAPLSLSTDTNETASPTPSPAPPLSNKAMISDPKFWSMALIMGALFSGPIAIISNLIQLVGEKGITPGQGALLISIFSGANLAGKLILAAAADRINHHLVLAMTMIGIGLGVIGLSQTNTFYLVAACCAVIGLFSGATTPVWSVILSHIYGVNQLGKIMGLMSLFIMPFTLSSPPLFGWVFDTSGSYNVALYGYVSMLCVALLLIANLRRLTASSALEIHAVQTGI